jgi:hypothetical protein
MSNNVAASTYSPPLEFVLVCPPRFVGLSWAQYAHGATPGEYKSQVPAGRVDVLVSGAAATRRNHQAARVKAPFLLGGGYRRAGLKCEPGKAQLSLYRGQ